MKKKNIMTSTSIFASVMALAISGQSMAEDDKEKNKYDTTCPQAVMDNADMRFGDGSGAMTECLGVRDNLPIVVAFNSGVINGRNGHGQQVLNVRNLRNDYVNNYDMALGSEFNVAVVGYAAGARWLLNDTAFTNSYGTENPSDQIVSDLIAKGVTFFMCQNTMRGNGWTKYDLIDGVKMIPAGVTAVIDYQNRGYSYIAP